MPPGPELPAAEGSGRSTTSCRLLPVQNSSAALSATTAAPMLQPAGGCHAGWAPTPLLLASLLLGGAAEKGSASLACLLIPVVGWVGNSTTAWDVTCAAMPAVPGQCRLPAASVCADACSGKQSVTSRKMPPAEGAGAWHAKVNRWQMVTRNPARSPAGEFCCKPSNTRTQAVREITHPVRPASGCLQESSAMPGCGDSQQCAAASPTDQ